MKGRSGFVSNSSTASFVLLGFDASEIARRVDFWDSEKYEDFRDQHDCLVGDEGGCPAGVSLVVGKYLLYSPSDGWAEGEVLDVADVMAEVEEIKKELGLDTKIRIWAGVKMC